MRLPFWFWWVLGGVLTLIICAVCKVDIGVTGGQFHFGQGLVRKAGREVAGPAGQLGLAPELAPGQRPAL